MSGRAHVQVQFDHGIGKSYEQHQEQHLIYYRRTMVLLIAFDRYTELCESVNGYNLVVRASRRDMNISEQTTNHSILITITNMRHTCPCCSKPYKSSVSPGKHTIACKKNGLLERTPPTQEPENNRVQKHPHIGRFNEDDEDDDEQPGPSNSNTNEVCHI